MNRQKLSRAFTLIEVLVTIVILAIGILTVIRIYPKGFVSLRLSAEYATAQRLARGEIERLQNQASDLPEQILAVQYLYQNIGGNWTLVIVSDPDSRQDDLGPGGSEILENGNIVINNPGGTDTEIFYRYYNDANRFRRVIGEGGTIPAPRPVGIYFGGLRTLNFGPIVDDANLLLVYGPAMDGRRIFRDPGDPIRNFEQWQFRHDEDNGQIWLPGVQGRAVNYKVNFSYWANDPVYGYRKVDVIDAILTVTETPNPGNPREALFDVGNNEVYPFDMRAVAGNPVDWIELVDFSVECNRLFDRLPDAAVFSGNYPYEYKVLSPTLGMILFNPAGYNFYERRRGGRVPLTAQINYDVYNWHILRDDFRGDRGVLNLGPRPTLHKLPLDQLKSFDSIENDRRRHRGLDFPIPDGLGGFTTTQDVLLVDLDTGGIVLPFVDPTNPALGRSYKVDYLRGTIALAGPGASDAELSQAGLTILPVGTGQAAITGVNPAGRNFRVFYQAQNDWAVQVFKAPSRFSVTYGLPLSVGQAYAWNPVDNIGLPTRIYFPPSDVGSKVAVREIWYRDAANVLKVIRDQDFQVRPIIGGDPFPNPNYGFIDIRDIDPTATSLDYASYGYAIRGISGTSLRARVIWNAATKDDLPGNGPAQIAERLRLHEYWTQQWRTVAVETYLTRRDSN
jgi:prepilin-type N-terminal cleavage/methylation domain-containing protein